MRSLFLAVILLASSVLDGWISSSLSGDGAAGDGAAGFLQRHCFACHGADAEPEMIRLDQLLVSDGLAARIVEVIETGEMPPPGYERPAEADSRVFVEQLIDRIASAAPPRPMALRRMNRREYENTIHDLLGIDVPLLDLLPEDGSVQGFDNVAAGLSISSVLMERYLEAANVAFDAVIRRIRPLPAEVRRVELMDVKDNIESVKQKKGGTIEVGRSFVKFTPGWPPARIDPVHPIEDGVYRFRVAVWPHDPSERTLAVAIYVGSLFGPETRKFMGIYDVTGTPENPRVIEFTTHIQEGHAIHIVPRIWPEYVTWRDKHEPRPGIGILWAETSGPLDQSFPSEAQKRLFGDVESITMEEDQPIYMRHRKGVKTHLVKSSEPWEDAERIIRDFIPRAFRRPVSEVELQPFLGLTLAKRESGRTFEQAVRAGVTAILCAPQFLFLNDSAAVDSAVVDDYTLASRLSYFLWSSMPDARLMMLAAQGELGDPSVRRAEVERMLADKKSQAFVENFTGQWLDLRDIEFTTPDGKLYPEFDPLLQEAMLGETRKFFTHMLHEDLSVLNFIDSDWTFLNERLARHYGIADVRGQEVFRKVTLPADCVRGGVLTQASVLKVTANGTTTSPVIRGAWVLDSLLGRPAPPPPPGVPAVEPDIRGATTIREQLTKHRDIEACASCHRRIDPAGFALEQFDAIGGEREFYRSLGEGEKIPGNKNYRKGPDVEPHSRFVDGRPFRDFEEFRALLLEDKVGLARGIAGKLLVYGTGRKMSLVDRPMIDEVIRRAAKKDYGLRSMVHAVVESDLFLHR